MKISTRIRLLVVGAVAVLALAGCGGGGGGPSVSKKCEKHPQWKVCKGTTSTTS